MCHTRSLAPPHRWQRRPGHSSLLCAVVSIIGIHALHPGSAEARVAQLATTLAELHRAVKVGAEHIVVQAHMDSRELFDNQYTVWIFRPNTTTRAIEGQCTEDNESIRGLPAGSVPLLPLKPEQCVILHHDNLFTFDESSHRIWIARLYFRLVRMTGLGSSFTALRLNGLGQATVYLEDVTMQGDDQKECKALDVAMNGRLHMQGGIITNMHGSAHPIVSIQGVVSFSQSDFESSQSSFAGIVVSGPGAALLVTDSHFSNFTEPAIAHVTEAEQPQPTSPRIFVDRSMESLVQDGVRVARPRVAPSRLFLADSEVWVQQAQLDSSRLQQVPLTTDDHQQDEVSDVPSQSLVVGLTSLFTLLFLTSAVVCLFRPCSAEAQTKELDVHGTVANYAKPDDNEFASGYYPSCQSLGSSENISAQVTQPLHAATVGANEP